MVSQGAVIPVPKPVARPVEMAPPPQKGDSTPLTPYSPGGSEVHPLDRLAHACQTGDLKVVQSLAPSYANALCGSGKFPVLFIAACSGSASVVGSLLKSGADVNVRAASNATPLFAAATRGHAAVAQILLASQADPNLLASNGASPLFAASGKGHLPIVDMLLAAGAGADLPTSAGATALIIAIQKQNASVVKALLRHANPDKTQKDVTPLLFATKLRNERIVRELLAAGASAAACGPGGITPVFCAAVDGADNILQILLETEAGRATADQPNQQGETPISIALKAGKTSCHHKLVAAKALRVADAKVVLAASSPTPKLARSSSNGSAANLPLLAGLAAASLGGASGPVTIAVPPLLANSITPRSAEAAAMLAGNPFGASPRAAAPGAAGTSMHAALAPPARAVTATGGHGGGTKRTAPDGSGFEDHGEREEQSDAKKAALMNSNEITSLIAPLSVEEGFSSAP